MVTGRQHTSLAVLLLRTKKFQEYPTQTERKMFGILGSIGHVFLFQHLIRPYIVDFYFPDYKLAIEVDGDHHLLPERAEYDRRRTGYLTGSRGGKVWGVLRFPNRLVETDELRVTLDVERAIERINNGVYG